MTPMHVIVDQTSFDTWIKLCWLFQEELEPEQVQQLAGEAAALRQALDKVNRLLYLFIFYLFSSLLIPT